MYYIYVDVQSLCVYKYIITYTESCYTFCPVEFFSWSTINMSENIKCTLSYDISLWYSILGKFHNLFRLPPIVVNLRYNEIFSAINCLYKFSLLKTFLCQPIGYFGRGRAHSNFFSTTDTSPVLVMHLCKG